MKLQGIEIERSNSSLDSLEFHLRDLNWEYNSCLTVYVPNIAQQMAALCRTGIGSKSNNDTTADKFLIAGLGQSRCWVILIQDKCRPDNLV